MRYTKTYALNPGRLDKEAGAVTGLDIRSPQTTGLAAGEWCIFGIPGEFPRDQRDDDAKSLTFDSGPLGERLEILGAPVANLELAADRPDAFVAVRLNDVAPDGTSMRVSYGVLNLTHRSGHEHPEPLEPGARYTVRVRLNDVAHAFGAGHRIRVAVSSSYWPIVWPSPEPFTLSLFAGASFRRGRRNPKTRPWRRSRRRKARRRSRRPPCGLDETCAPSSVTC